MVGASTWFRDKEKEEDNPQETSCGHNRKRKREPEPSTINRQVYETVLFVPITRGAELRRRLTKMEEGLNQPTRVRFVE